MLVSVRGPLWTCVLSDLHLHHKTEVINKKQELKFFADHLFQMQRT